MNRLIFLFAFLFVASSLATEYRVLIGYTPDERWVFSDFYPRMLDIHVGDSVLFMLNNDMPATINFNPSHSYSFNESSRESFHLDPQLLQAHGGHVLHTPNDSVSSGILMGNATYFFNFTAPGRYKYSSLLPPMMRGVINVLASNSSILSPDALNNRSEEMARLIRHNLIPGLIQVKGVRNRIPASRYNCDGTRTWTVMIVGDEHLKVEYLRFVPSNFSIRLGDTVEFVNDGTLVHTATFSSSGQFNSSQPLRASSMLSSNATKSEGGFDEIYKSGSATSGFLYPLRLYSHSMPHLWSITFGQTGIFPYRCDFDFQKGMVGRIIVR